MRRVFSVDVLACARCGGRLRPVATIDASDVTRRIQGHLGFPTEAPLPAVPSAPPGVDDWAILTRSLTVCLIRAPWWRRVEVCVQAGSRAPLREADPTVVRDSDRLVVQGRANLRRAKGEREGARAESRESPGWITAVPSTTPLNAAYPQPPDSNAECYSNDVDVTAQRPISTVIGNTMRNE
jgi:hypothetical protein